MLYGDFTTLDDLKRVRGIDDADADDDMLIRFIRQASRTVISFTNRTFVPYLSTRYYPNYGQSFASSSLSLDDDLISVSSLTDDGLALSSSDYILYPINESPYHSILLANGVTFTKGTSPLGIGVTGLWGYHPVPDLMWEALDSLQSALDEDDMTVSVEESENFEVLSYLKVEDEFMQVIAVDTENNTLTVQRGVRGSEAVAHNDDTTVSVYRISEDAQHATNRLASFFYERRDTTANRVRIGDGTYTFNDEVPPEVVNIIGNLQRMKVSIV